MVNYVVAKVFWWLFSMFNVVAKVFWLCLVCYVLNAVSVLSCGCQDVLLVCVVSLKFQ